MGLLYLPSSLGSQSCLTVCFLHLYLYIYMSSERSMQMRCVLLLLNHGREDKTYDNDSRLFVFDSIKISAE